MSIFKVSSGGVDTVCVGTVHADGSIVPIAWVSHRIAHGETDEQILAAWPALTPTDLAAVRAFNRVRWERFAATENPSGPVAKPDDDDGNYIK